MNVKYLYQKNILHLVAGGLLLLTIGCTNSTSSSKIKPTIDPCKDVSRIVWGKQGQPMPEDEVAKLVSCFDWELKAK